MHDATDGDGFQEHQKTSPSQKKMNGFQDKMFEYTSSALIWRKKEHPSNQLKISAFSVQNRHHLIN